MKKIYINYWIICLVFVGLFSCNNDDDQALFTEVPAERIAQRNSELQSLLESQEQGYRGVYFSKNDEFGGFTFYMKFNTDGTVIMTSDFDSETAVNSSTYEVRFGTTTELVFTTRNHIQKLSETSFLDPDGFRGTSVFQYFSNEDGKIAFRDVRNRDTAFLVLEPTNFSDFNTESVASVITTMANRNEFVNTPSATVFPFLSIEKDGKTTSYDLNYNQENLFANPIAFDDQGQLIEENFGIAFTEDGIIISPALEIDGVKFENFTFDDTNAFEYIANVDGAIAKIGYSNVPTTPLDIYNLESNTAAVFNMDERFKSSTAFNNFYDNYTNTLSANFGGLQITNIIIWNLLPADPDSFIQIRTNGFGTFDWGISYSFNNADDGIATFTLTGANGANVSPFITSVFQPILDEILNGTSGYYVVNAGNYLNFTNRTFSLVNVDDPTKAINFWTF